MTMPFNARLRRRLAALVVVAASLAPPFTAPASADPIADKRAEAARLAAKLDQLGERLSALDEDYNAARLKLAALRSRVADAQAEAARTRTAYDRARAAARERVVAAYVNGGTTSKAALLASTNDVLVGREYLAAATDRDRAVIERFRAAGEDLARQRQALAGEVAKATAAADRVAAARRAAAAAAAEQRQLLAQARGELAALVRADQQRRAAEAEARARAELAARQARARQEAAARANGAAAPRAARSAPAVADAPAGDAPAPSRGAGAAVQFAKAQLGKPYEWGAAGPDSYDCSGLTMRAWQAGGVSLPHSSRAQYSSTTHVPVSAIQPGDLIFYGSPIHHVGIYVGGGQMIEAPNSGEVVRYASIYRRDLVGVGRPG